jgi:hypothetical protein
MRLSAEQFAELTASFSGQQSSRHERRRAARMELQAKMKITPIVAGKRGVSSFAALCDFSARGLCILQSEAMESGQQFITEMPRKSGGNIELLCTAMHSRSITPSLYRIGAEFTCTLSTAQSFPSSAAKPDSNDEMSRIRDSMLT